MTRARHLEYARTGAEPSAISHQVVAEAAAVAAAAAVVCDCIWLSALGAVRGATASTFGSSLQGRTAWGGSWEDTTQDGPLSTEWGEAARDVAHKAKLNGEPVCWGAFFDIGTLVALSSPLKSQSLAAQWLPSNPETSPKFSPFCQPVSQSVSQSVSRSLSSAAARPSAGWLAGFTLHASQSRVPGRGCKGTTTAGGSAPPRSRKGCCGLLGTAVVWHGLLKAANGWFWAGVWAAMGYYGLR
ncbi:hypothetical protein AOQ84DRAFT_228858 [Glonium stellatum]|uniref:Uncharacterized protein n=1 Tax=Glonium stellatum TaxID=574774 RepID=A0A8E2F7W7_9PEZI|nr:hypothetical protein AOQ84DRAFT_228858 [Glonium stellatum]